MRRIVFELDDNRDIKGEVGLDNEGNLYLKGADGKSIRLLQDANSGDYSPEASNFDNIASLEMLNGGYVIMGKQCSVVLMFMKEATDSNEATAFDVTLPFPGKFTGEDSEAVAIFTNNSTSFTNFTCTADPGSGKVRVQDLGNPFYTGNKLFQVGFVYRLP